MIHAWFIEKKLAAANGWYYAAGMTRNLQIVSVKLPLADLRRIPGNRSRFVRRAVAEKLERESSPEWRPKTAKGRKLLKLRKEFLARGGELLDADRIAAELRDRRGGIS